MPRQVRLEDVIEDVWIEQLAKKVYLGIATEEEEIEFFKYIEDER